MIFFLCKVKENCLLLCVKTFFELQGNFLRKDVLVRNLPRGIEESAVRRRLNILSANCGGKVGRVSANCATIYFQTPELATR